MQEMASVEEEFLSFKFVYENKLTINGLTPVSWSLEQQSFNQRPNPLIQKFIAERLEEALSTKEESEDEEIGMCPECKEYTSYSDPCCGAEPITDGYDYDDIER